MIECVADLAFSEADEWIVVDFKTDASSALTNSVTVVRSPSMCAAFQKPPRLSHAGICYSFRRLSSGEDHKRARVTETLHLITPCSLSINTRRLWRHKRSPSHADVGPSIYSTIAAY